jgi:uncharacterized protein YcnI
MDFCHQFVYSQYCIIDISYNSTIKIPSGKSTRTEENNAINVDIAERVALIDFNSTFLYGK